MPILSGYDRGQLARIARGQYDVVARSQALECGMTRGAIEYRLRPDGPWRQILPGVYLTVTGSPSQEQRETAALLYAGPDSAITGAVYNADLYTLDGIFLGRPDAWFARAGVAGEVDSREYHLGAKDYDATARRHNRMEAVGIHVLHWLPSTIKAEPHRVIAELRAAIAAGNQRPQLPIRAIPPRA